MEMLSSLEEAGTLRSATFEGVLTQRLSKEQRTMMEKWDKEGRKLVLKALGLHGSGSESESDV